MFETEPKTDLELIFLGTGNAFTQAQRYWGTILLNDSILFDCSPITVPHMKNLGKQLTNLETIFITHFHGDHYFGLPFLLLDFAYLLEIDHPLNVVGPSGVKDKIYQVTDWAFPGIWEKLKGRLNINYFEVTSSGDIEVNGLLFQAQALAHGSAEAFGYKITIAEKTVGYTGDTDLCDGMFELGKGADVLIIEMSNPDLDIPGHMSLNKLQELRNNLDPKTKVILNHVGEFSGELPKMDNVILPRDLETIRF